jgi:hypothetical protein
MNQDRDGTGHLARLRARTSDARDELDEIRSGDPCAATALRAVRLTRYTLDGFWIPALDDLLTARRTQPDGGGSGASEHVGRRQPGDLDPAHQPCQADGGGEGQRGLGERGHPHRLTSSPEHPHQP